MSVLTDTWLRTIPQAWRRTSAPTLCLTDQELSRLCAAAFRLRKTTGPTRTHPSCDHVPFRARRQCLALEPMIDPAPATPNKAWAAGRRKETQMNQWQLAMVVMAITETPWGPRDAEGRRRVYTDARTRRPGRFSVAVGWRDGPHGGERDRGAIPSMPTCQHPARTDPSAISRINVTRVSSCSPGRVGSSLHRPSAMEGACYAPKSWAPFSCSRSWYAAGVPVVVRVNQAAVARGAPFLGRDKSPWRCGK